MRVIETIDRAISPEEPVSEELFLQVAFCLSHSLPAGLDSLRERWSLPRHPVERFACGMRFAEAASAVTQSNRVEKVQAPVVCAGNEASAAHPGSPRVPKLGGSRRCAE